MCDKRVSIHTPTQGVTVLVIHQAHALHVSIHTPTQGVTVVWVFTHFHVVVSIHTPTQGVTLDESCPYTFNYVFQSTHPRRV